MKELDKHRKYDLEERLIDFAVLITEISSSMLNTETGRHFSNQLVRSGTSPALHYGEAQSAESRNDFIHKLKVLLKELRESRVCLIITKRISLSRKMDLVEKAIPECNELISIFVKSVETAKRNSEAEVKAKSKIPIPKNNVKEE